MNGFENIYYNTDAIKISGYVEQLPSSPFTFRFYIKLLSKEIVSIKSIELKIVNSSEEALFNNICVTDKTDNIIQCYSTFKELLADSTTFSEKQNNEYIRTFEAQIMELNKQDKPVIKIDIKYLLENMNYHLNDSSLYNSHKIKIENPVRFH